MSDDVAAWMTAYLVAWRTRDADAAARLFTAHAVYESSPGDPTQRYEGRAAIAAYWTRITAAQSDIRTRQGDPLVCGAQAMIEIWVTLRIAGKPTTIAEANVLTFDADGLCRRNVEYAVVYDGFVAPPPGWGRH